ncbi:MAG: M48 family metalloprotease [Pseudomonadota bacterium]
MANSADLVSNGVRRLAAFIAALLACVSGTGAAQAQSIIRDAEIEALIRDYSDPIFSAAGLPPSNVGIHLIADPSINAFVANGLNMYVFTGLLAQADTPNQVIGVIAHETGHMSGGHLARSDEAIAAATRPILLTMGLGLAAVLAGAPEAGIGIIAGGQTAAERTFLKYSRSQEASADQAAITFLDATQQSGVGLYEFFDKLRDDLAFSGRRINPYTVTHPLPGQRIESLKRRIQSSPYREAKDSPEEQHRFDMARAKIQGFLTSPYSTFRAYPHDDQSQPARYARTIAYYLTPDIDRALEGVNDLIAEEPENPFFHELKGQMLFEHGRVADAIAPHAKSVELKPSVALLHVNVARAYLATESVANAEKSLQHLKLATQSEPKNSFAWFEMANAYGFLDNEPMANLATAERYFAIGARREAFTFARRAKAGLTPNTPEWRSAIDIMSLTTPSERELRQQQRRRRGSAPSFSVSTG